VGWQTAADAVASGFAEAFGVDFVHGELSLNERDAAEKFAAEVYGSDAWTFRR
jgi:lipoate-protein ligase A